jgi:hypothetical protein
MTARSDRVYTYLWAASRTARIFAISTLKDDGAAGGR